MEVERSFNDGVLSLFKARGLSTPKIDNGGVEAMLNNNKVS